jgi:FAD/FMN-containing dehydrogenase
MRLRFERKTVKTRREFIKHNTAVGLVLAFSKPWARLSFGGGSELDPAVVKKFGASLKGRLILPGDVAYDGARRVFFRNAATEKRPAMIARCSGVEDIARCIDFARQHDLPAAVRSGGHSTLGWGTCEGGIVIDVSALKSIRIDPVKRTVRAGAGLQAQELVSAAGRYQLAPVLGECPTVGVSGLTLGGGFGWLSGKYGAACDNLLSADLFTFDCRSVIASAGNEPDLFWAIRGGGGNFGIAASFEFLLHPVNAVLAGGIKYPFSEARAVLRFYRDFMAAAPDELQALAHLPGVGDRSLNIVVCYSGDLNEAEKVIRPLLAFTTPLHDTVKRRPYGETFTMPLYHEGNPARFRAAKNCYLEHLSDSAIDVVVDRFAHRPQAGCALGLDHYMHGAVCRVAPDSTALELRTPGAVHVWITSGWDDPMMANTSIAWVNSAWEALKPFSGGRIYANYLSVEGEEAVKGAFGKNYPKLVAIKNKYDPTNFFKLNPNIPPQPS